MIEVLLRDKSGTWKESHENVSYFKILSVANFEYLQEIRVANISR